jgi:heme-degrading monooxygenase HmoA
MKQIFIDQFIIPLNARDEFIERMTINRNFIKTLPGFIEDAAYERVDEQQNTICITIAAWESEMAIKNAKAAVQALYEKQGFDMPAMLDRLGIKMERGLYQKRDEN